MKKVIIADFMEYDDPSNKLGNYHYAKLFAENGYEVLWMSCPWNWLMYLKNKDAYKNRKKLSTPIRHKLDENIYGFAPYSTKLYGDHLGCRSSNIVLNFKKYIRPNINESLKKIGFAEVDILWISNPKQYWLSNVVKYKKMITRLPDDYSEIGSFPKTIVDIEKELLRKSDTVFTISKNLADKKRNIRSDIKYLPNGVELDNFIRNEYIIPTEFQNNNRKKCIYVGAIGKWFDIGLVKYCAECLKLVDFYIIGQPKIDIKELEQLNNVHILGKKAYTEIPNYLYYSDVAIIPFVVNDLTNSVSPIKLYEYMSVGLNVVSTDLEEVKNIDSPAYISKNKKEFCEYILKGIKNKEENKLTNSMFAKVNTWKKRFEFIDKNV